MTLMKPAMVLASDSERRPSESHTDECKPPRPHRPAFARASRERLATARSNALCRDREVAQVGADTIGDDSDEGNMDVASGDGKGEAIKTTSGQETSKDDV